MASYEGGVGVGGKVRRKPFLRRASSSTPYDRPPISIRNPNEERTGWISKLIDPASRVISRNAHRLFSSMFRKALPRLGAEVNRESRNGGDFREGNGPFTNFIKNMQHPDNNGNNSNDAEKLTATDMAGTPLESFMVKWKEIITGSTSWVLVPKKVFLVVLILVFFSPLEEVTEIEHLTELLRSRTVDVVGGNNNNGYASSTPEPARGGQDSRELANTPLKESKMDNQILLGAVSSCAPISNFIEQNIHSPAELAKAYMGSRPSNVSPLDLGLRNQLSNEDISLQTKIPFTPMSTNMSLAPRSAVRINGVSENVYTTPRPRGRSAIYNMARTPYSRVHQTGTPKIDRYADPLTLSQSPWENHIVSVGRQGLKRRSSILYSDIGSVGPIRRIRQKASMMSTPSTNMELRTNGSPLSIPTVEPGSRFAQGSTSSMQTQFLVDGSRHDISYMKRAEHDDNSSTNTNSAYVPSQSSNMAKKILQQLDKLAPSPKEKSSELKLTLAREKSPSELTLNMLHGQALKSVRNVDSSKLLQDVRRTGASDGLDRSLFPKTLDVIFGKEDKCETNGPMKTASIPKSYPKIDALESTTSIKGSTSISHFVPVSEKKKRAFQMSAHEDFLELDDDSELVATPPTIENEKLDTYALGSNSVIFKKLTEEKSSSEAKLHVNSVFNKETSSSPINVDKNGGFTFSAAANTQKATPVSPPLQFSEKTPRPMEASAAPVFSFNTNSLEKGSPPASSSMASGVSLFSGTVLSVQSDSKQKPLRSNASDAVAVEASPRIAESDKSGKAQTLKSGDLLRTSESFTPANVSTSVTPNSFTFGASASQSSINNTPFSSTPLFAIPAAFSASTSTAAEVFSTTVTTKSISGTTPLSSTFPIFSFGSGTSASIVPSSSTSLPSATLAPESTTPEAKTEQLPSFGNSTSNNLFEAATSSTFTSCGSGIFGFSVAAPSSTISKSSAPNNESQSSNLFGKSLFGVQGTSGGIETKVTPSTQSMPSQFGSSAPSPPFGLRGSSTLSSTGTALSGASVPAVKFGSSSVFGSSSSTTFSTSTTSLTSGPSATTGLFSFSSPSSIFGSGIGSSSVTAFPFGTTSAAAPVAASAPVAFGSTMGSSSGSMFSFNSASATPSSTSFSQAGSLFGTTANPFGSTFPSNDQMNMEDSMAEDTVQASTSNISPFGQPVNSPSPSNFMFSSPTPSGGPPVFQFGGLQNSGAPPQNPSPFQASGNLDFGSNAGSFSLGTGGGDKAGRKIVKVKRNVKRR
ncbi:hypothetical protein GIB67_023146 [Kingdonia uniflora]|uniref:Nuclear pore complex protein NUP1 n=1 Tax=Kingdonia uniflora TaxID=39325 RepID=A0A7J7M5L7_9MAGN|nr:hypothetical protein GIB67_023146 [Kingdonia uniflora]